MKICGETESITEREILILGVFKKGLKFNEPII